jgi:hypothetical protein
MKGYRASIKNPYLWGFLIGMVALNKPLETPMPQPVKRTNITFGKVIAYLLALVTFAGAVIAGVRSLDNLTVKVDQTNQLVLYSIARTAKFDETCFKLFSVLHNDKKSLIETAFREYYRDVSKMSPLSMPIAYKDDKAYSTSSPTPGFTAFVFPGAKEGEKVPVWAMANGKVVSIEKGKADSCYTIEIASNELKQTHMYEHLKEIDVKKGDIVSKGQKIGNVVPCSPACFGIGIKLAIGIKSSSDSFINPRWFLPDLPPPENSN